MKIELLKHYGMSSPGNVLDNVNKPVADLLIKRKIAKIFKPKKSKKKASKND